MEVAALSSTIQVFNGERFYLCGTYFQHKGKRLHREVWQYHHGPIPEGFDVHHVHHDRSRNQIEDLELIPRSIHRQYHADERGVAELAKAPIVKAQAATAEWHGSTEGRAWHKQHYADHSRAAFARLVDCVCSHCATPFQAVNRGHASVFCSNRCKSAFRRAHGVDRETPTAVYVEHCLPWSVGIRNRRPVVECVEGSYVVSVRPAGRADVYCLTVPHGARFAIEGGIIVHNCYDMTRYELSMPLLAAVRTMEVLL